MCKYCRIENQDNHRHLRSNVFVGRHNQDSSKGFYIGLFTGDEIKIEKTFLNPDKDSHETISYLKAWKYDHQSGKIGSHIAVRIYYCPFCGEKL